MIKKRGTREEQRKLTQRIRDLYDSGLTRKEITRKVGIAYVNVCVRLNNRDTRSVEYEVFCHKCKKKLILRDKNFDSRGHFLCNDCFRKYNKKNI